MAMSSNYNHGYHHSGASTSWQDENEKDVRHGSGPFGSPDLHAASGIDPESRRSMPGSSASRRSASHRGFDGDAADEGSGLSRPPPPKRRDLMAGSRPRPIVPKSLSEAYRIAQAVCAAKMAPKGLDTPEACMIAIMHGLEVGLSPLSALQRIAVINGRPTLWGDGALALVKASGLCEAIDEWIEGEKPEDWVAVCNLIRKHDPVPVERRFSSQDAKRARLWGKSGSWSDYPKRMLQMRARAFALRDAFPDVLGGLYLTEEFIETAELPSEGDAPQSRSPHSETKGAFRYTSGAEDLSGLQKDSQSADKEFAGVAENQLNMQSGNTAPSFEGIQEQAFKETDRSANEAISENSSPLTTSPLPPLANLRRSRQMPRHIRAFRFRNQWSVKQPRAPRSDNHRDGGQEKAAAAQSVPSGSSDGAMKGISPAGDNHTAERTGETFLPPDDIAAHLDLYDAALCCATDEHSLLEIAEEFTERLSSLPRQGRTEAELIFEKHETRISVLDLKPAVLANGQTKQPISVVSKNIDQAADEISSLTDTAAENGASEPD